MAGIYEKLLKHKDLADKLVPEDKIVEFISTNVLVLNLLFSGRIRGGIRKGMISQISADSALGKCCYRDEKIKIFVNAEDKKNIELFLNNSY